MDGYLADKNHNLDWLYQTGAIEETGYESFYESMDITIMGKRTFNEIGSTENIGSFYPTTKNYVFTHDDSVSVRNFIPINYDIVEFVKQIEKDKNIWIVGGNTILAPLLDNDMVDNMIIQIAPRVIREGNTLVFTKRSTEAVLLERSKTIRTICRISL